MLIFVLLCFTPLAVANKSIEYLQTYGYIDENSLSSDIGAAVTLFQEVFHIEQTGVLDNATIELLNVSRCGNKDTLLPFSAKPNRKWNSTVITWFMYGTTQHNALIERAFNVWGRHANIVFRRDFTHPTIIISFSGTRAHVHFSKHENCHYDFDGPGLVLAHAFLPESGYNQTDIHFDSEENWDFSMDLPPNGKISFFLTLVHEIGHALGLDHSYDNSSVMFPLHTIPRGIANLDEYELSRDDILAIQYLYGQPVSTTSTTSTTTTSTTTTTTTTTTTATPEVAELFEQIDICDFKTEITTYLIVNKKIYVFLRDLVWVLDINPSYRNKDDYTKPKKLLDWLTFLPKNFTKISGIYQRPNSNIALFTDREVYIFRFPSLILTARYKVSDIVKRPMKKVNTVVSSYRGKTYIIYDDWYLMDIDECSYTGTFLGITTNTLNGIPTHVKGAFRYINGELYFFTDSSVLAYNEFTNTVTESKSDIFDILGITCMRESLITRLYAIIKYLQ